MSIARNAALFLLVVWLICIPGWSNNGLSMSVAVSPTGKPLELPRFSSRNTVNVFVTKEFDLPGSAGLTQYVGKSKTTVVPKGKMTGVFGQCPIGQPVSCFCPGLGCTWLAATNIVGNECACYYWAPYDGCANLDTYIRMICTSQGQ